MDHRLRGGEGDYNPAGDSSPTIYVDSDKREATGLARGVSRRCYTRAKPE